MRSTVSFIIPMAGAGSRFAKAGYTLPKPLIPIHGKPMIDVVIQNLTPSRYKCRFIFLVQKAQIEKYAVDEKLRTSCPGCEVVTVNGLTEGAACTVLLAKRYITNDPMVIANCDQFVDCSIDDFLDAWFDHDYDGMIMTMTANDPKWSFVGFDADGQVNRVVEKEVISNEATVGIYGFTRGSDFVSAAEDMIAANERVKNEFYVALAYNRLIKAGARIGIWNIGSERHGMYGLGIPADLDYFLSLPWTKKLGIEDGKAAEEQENGR